MSTSRHSSKRARAPSIEGRANAPVKRTRRPKAKQTAQETKTPTTFYDLPPELRNAVYEFYFEDLVAPLNHPWNPLPSNKRFEPYVDLLQTSRQVYREAKSLFVQDYAHRVVFYYTNATELVRYVQNEWAPDHSVEGNAHFVLRQSEDIEEAPHLWELKRLTKEFFSQQPGFKLRWHHITTRFHSASFDDDETPEWPPDWKAEDDGFEVTAGCLDGYKRSVDGESYRLLKWPVFDNRIRLTAYTYLGVPQWPGPDDYPGQVKPLDGTLMEGKLADLYTEDFDLDEGTLVLEHTTSVDCDAGPEGCYLCHNHQMGECECLATADDYSDDGFMEFVEGGRSYESAMAASSKRSRQREAERSRKMRADFAAAQAARGY